MKQFSQNKPNTTKTFKQHYHYEIYKYCTKCDSSDSQPNVNYTLGNGRLGLLLLGKSN